MLDWLRLIRASGIFTLASNLLAALSVAVYSQGLDYSLLGHELYRHGDRLLIVAGSSLLLYACGMVWNDIADYRRDVQLNPRRPLPAGRISLPQAMTFGWLAAIGALGLAAQLGWRGWGMAGVILSLAMAYNFLSKNLAWLGSFNMALVRAAHAMFCLLALDPVYFDRMFHTLLSLVGLLPLYFAELTPSYPLLLGLYVLGLTLVSELETRRGRRLELLLAGGLMLAALLGALQLALTAHWLLDLLQQGKVILLAMAVFLLVLLAAWQLWRLGRPFIAAVRAGEKRLVTPVLIKGLGGIILFDGLVAMAFHPILGLLALALLAPFLLTSRLIRMN